MMHAPPHIPWNLDTDLNSQLCWPEITMTRFWEKHSYTWDMTLNSILYITKIISITFKVVPSYVMHRQLLVVRQIADQISLSQARTSYHRVEPCLDLPLEQDWYSWWHILNPKTGVLTTIPKNSNTPHNFGLLVSCWCQSLCSLPSQFCCDA